MPVPAEAPPWPVSWAAAWSPSPMTSTSCTKAWRVAASVVAHPSRVRVQVARASTSARCAASGCFAKSLAIAWMSCSRSAAEKVLPRPTSPRANWNASTKASAFSRVSDPPVPVASVAPAVTGSPVPAVPLAVAPAPAVAAGAPGAAMLSKPAPGRKVIGGATVPAGAGVHPPRARTRAMVAA